MFGCQVTKPSRIYWGNSLPPIYHPALLGSCAGGDRCQVWTLGNIDGSYSISAVLQSKYSWQFRASNYITWGAVSVYRVTLTTSSCPSMLLYTAASKNRFWPFLKKTLSNNFADKSHSTPTLGQCEWYVCVDLFMLPLGIFMVTMSLLLSFIYSLYVYL